MRSRLWYPHIASPTIARPRVFAFTPDAPLWKGCKFFAGGCNPGGLRAEDSSPFRNHGTLTNMDPPSDTLFKAELQRTAWNFDGGNDCILAPTNRVLDFGAGTFSVSVFESHVAETPSQPFYRCVSKQILTTDGFSLYCRTSDGAMRVNRAGVFVSPASPVNVLTGDIFHLCGVFHGDSNAYFYVNGSSNGSASVGVGNVDINEPLGMGNDVASGGFYSWSGMLADPGIWSRVLTASELRVLANRSDAMLDGALYDPSRVSVAPGYAASASPWLYARRRSQIIGSGLGV